jgi:hypothetical protein
MTVKGMKSLAGLVGGVSIVAAITVCLVDSAASPTSNDVAGGGSGDSATGTQYTQPVLPAMSIDPTGLSTGATATANAPATTLAVSVASPTFKATPPPGF